MDPYVDKELTVLEKLTFKIAVNVVGYSPEFLNREDVPSGYIEKKKSEFVSEEGSQFNVEKLISEVVLMEQNIVEANKPVKALLQSAGKYLGTNATIAGYSKILLGEGITK